MSLRTASNATLVQPFSVLGTRSGDVNACFYTGIKNTYDLLFSQN